MSNDTSLTRHCSLTDIFRRISDIVADGATIIRHTWWEWSNSKKYWASSFTVTFCFVYATIIQKNIILMGTFAVPSPESKHRKTSVIYYEKIIFPSQIRFANNIISMTVLATSIMKMRLKLCVGAWWFFEFHWKFFPH